MATKPEEIKPLEPVQPRPILSPVPTQGMMPPPTVGSTVNKMAENTFGPPTGLGNKETNFSVAPAGLQPLSTLPPAAPAPAAPVDNVETRVAGIINKNSPLMKQAAAGGLAMANRRGLANSTMGVQAAQGELYRAAVPIASTDATLSAQERIAKSEQAAQMERLKYQTASTEGMQKAEHGQQKYLQTVEGKQRMSELVAQIKSSEKVADKQIAAEMERLMADNAAEMAQLNKQLATANAQQKIEIAAQMDRLELSLDAEMDRLTKAAGYDMQRLREQGKIDIARDAAQAKNATELAKVQGQIQSKLQAEGNSQQIQRMNLDLVNQMKLQDDQQASELKRLAAAGDQEIRRLVEAGNQERVTLQQTIASGDRERMSNAMVNIFQVEAQMRAALLANTNIPAEERAAYEKAITSLGDPIRAYVNKLYGTAAAPTPAPTTNTPAPGGMLPPGTTAAPLPTTTGMLPAGTVSTPPKSPTPAKPTPSPPKPTSKPATKAGGGSKPKTTKQTAKK